MLQGRPDNAYKQVTDWDHLYIDVSIVKIILQNNSNFEMLSSCKMLTLRRSKWSRWPSRWTSTKTNYNRKKYTNQNCILTQSGTSQSLSSTSKNLRTTTPCLSSASAKSQAKSTSRTTWRTYGQAPYSKSTHSTRAKISQKASLSKSAYQITGETK